MIVYKYKLVLFISGILWLIFYSFIIRVIIFHLIAVIIRNMKVLYLFINRDLTIIENIIILYKMRYRGEVAFKLWIIFVCSILLLLLFWFMIETIIIIIFIIYNNI